MSKVSIKKATREDVPAFFAMLRELAELEGDGAYVATDVETLLRDGFGGKEPRFGLFLAQLDGRTVGYVSYVVGYSIWAGKTLLNVDDVFVAEHARAAGVGKLLMKEVARECLAAGHAYARWTVEADNERAIGFYKRIGAGVREKRLCGWRPAEMAAFLEG
jgi:GNAT superfamily N-acetyltransferase